MYAPMTLGRSAQNRSRTHELRLPASSLQDLPQMGSTYSLPTHETTLRRKYILLQAVAVAVLLLHDEVLEARAFLLRNKSLPSFSPALLNGESIDSRGGVEQLRSKSPRLDTSNSCAFSGVVRCKRRTRTANNQTQSISNLLRQI